MIIVAQQPHYLPWLGFWELLSRAEHIVFLDNVQWLKQGGQRRARLLNANKPTWLSVPLVAAKQAQNINELMCVEPEKWASSHWAYIEHCYKKRPYFAKQLKPILFKYYDSLGQVRTKVSLLKINQELTFLIAPYLGLENLESKCSYSSQLDTANKTKTELIGLCEEFILVLKKAEIDKSINPQQVMMGRIGKEFSEPLVKAFVKAFEVK